MDFAPSKKLPVTIVAVIGEVIEEINRASLIIGP